MRRHLATGLDKLHPDWTSDRPPISEVREAIRVFSPHDTVFVRNYPGGPAWIPATVVRVTDPVSYEVALSDGRITGRHVDHVHR